MLNPIKIKRHPYKLIMPSNIGNDLFEPNAMVLVQMAQTTVPIVRSWKKKTKFHIISRKIELIVVLAYLGWKKFNGTNAG